MTSSQVPTKAHELAMSAEVEPSEPAASVGLVMPTTITVVLCTYQGVQYLSPQLQSLLAQQRLPNEILVFDDASNDGTWGILLAFVDEAATLGVQVVIHSNPTNLGYVANFTQALRAARGDLVFLCDQDDVWHADKISRFADEFARRPDLLMLHSDADLVDQDGHSLNCKLFEAFEVSYEELAGVHDGEAFEVLVKRNIVTGATMAIRRSVIANGFDVPHGWIHDEWLAMVAATQGRVDCLEASTIDYRQHGNNQVGARPRGFIERVTGGSISRADFMARMLARTQSMMDQSASGQLALSVDERRLLSERLRHAQLRANLPTTTSARTAAVLSEYASGRYGEFGNGLRSMLSDLFKLGG